LRSGLSPSFSLPWLHPALYMDGASVNFSSRYAVGKWASLWASGKNECLVSTNEGMLRIAMMPREFEFGSDPNALDRRGERRSEDLNGSDFRSS